MIEVHDMSNPVLEVENLKTCFDTRDGMVTAVDGVSLKVNKGECLGIVGESGSGKSVTFGSVMGLVKKPGFIAEGSIKYNGRELVGLEGNKYRRLRGKEIAMTMPKKKLARIKAIDIMRLVGIPAAESRLDEYPHEFSGGMRQRIMIAIALSCKPTLLIADEPTTALDVTIQAQVLELIADIQEKMGMSVVLITHDLGVVAEYCDRVMVMYAGQIVESGPTGEVINFPQHPYTQGLLNSIPRLSDLDRKITPIEGSVPDLIGLAAQCRFLGRCVKATDACKALIDMRESGVGRQVRCINAEISL
jgi:oligopeptide/dipeptide ABC transporter ATP-binding protein